MGILGQKIIKNSYYSFVGQSARALARFASSIVIARMLGPSLTGIYSLGLLIYYIAEIVTNLGLGNLVTKYVSQFAADADRKRTERIFSYVVKAKLILASLVSILMICLSGYLADFYREPSLKLYVVFFAIILLPAAIALIFENTIQGLQEYKALAIRNVVMAPLHIILIVVALKLHYGIAGIIAANFITAVLDLAIFYYFIKKRFKLKFRFGESLGAESGKIFTYNWQVAIIVILDAIVWQRTEVFFLGKYSTASAVAFYSLSYNLTTWLVGFLPSIVIGVLFPAFSELHGSGDRATIAKLFFNATRYYLMFCIPILMGGIVLSSVCVTLLYGNAYAPMAPVLSILLVSTSVYLICAPAILVLYGTERQHIVLVSAIIATTINIGLNLTLIPRYGAIGAAVANAAAQITSVIICTIKLLGNVSMKFPVADLLKCTGCSLIILAVPLFVGMVDKSAPAMVLSVAAGGVAYVFFIIYSGMLRVSDMNLLSLIREKLPLRVQSGYGKILEKIEKYAVPDTL